MGKNIVQKIIDAHYVSGDKKPGKEVLPGRSELPHPWSSPYFAKMIFDFVLIRLSMVS